MLSSVKVTRSIATKNPTCCRLTPPPPRIPRRGASCRRLKHHLLAQHRLEPWPVGRLTLDQPGVAAQEASNARRLAGACERIEYHITGVAIELDQAAHEFVGESERFA